MPTNGTWVKRGALLIGVFACLSVSVSGAPDVKPGDVVFHTSRSSQSQAIQLATHSPYSHMGLVLVRSGRPFVLEAVEPVRLTALSEWAARGEGGKYVVKRLKDARVLGAPGKLEQLERAALSFQGRPYDPYFEWSDDRIYCSELVWKAYDRGLGIQLGALVTLSTFDLGAPPVRMKLAERYGSKIPLNQKVISPAAIFDSPLLTTVN